MSRNINSPAVSPPRLERRCRGGRDYTGVEDTAFAEIRLSLVTEF